MLILPDDHSDEYRSDYRRLVKLSDREAFDPTTGDRYRIERQDQPSGPGGGFVLAVLLGVLLWLLMNTGGIQAPRPLPTPERVYPTQPMPPIG
ncbi:MAG: hypothetical protein OHK0037_40790 [Elainellaceae cyanobacterium]